MISEPSPASVLNHLAIIPDGNRRWAREHGLATSAGHRAGISNATTIVSKAWSLGISTVTFWWGSPSSLLNRELSEVVGIHGSLTEWYALQTPVMSQKWNATVEVIGDWSHLLDARSIQAGPFDTLERDHPTHRLTVLFGYDGRSEIVEAIRASSGTDISVDRLGAMLWTGHLPPVDLVVRTGGGNHLSAGFMLWQIAESRISFEAPLWPAFTGEDLEECIARATVEPRRFGR